MQLTIDRNTRARSTVLLIAAGSVITSIMLGARSTFGLYLEPVTDALQTDRGTFALAIAVQNLIWGITQPFFGAVADRFGSARVLMAGAVGYALSMLLLASADGTGLLILSAGFLVGAATGAASFAVVLSAVGRLVPDDRRSMALGVVTAMGSVGQFVLVPTAQRLLSAYGWRQTVAIVGLLALLVVVCTRPLRGNSAQQLAAMAAGVARDRTELDDHEVVAPDPGYSAADDLRRAVRHRSYVMLNMAFFVCGFHVTFIGTHLPAFVSDQGIDAGVAATALALIGLFNIVGSLTAGALGIRRSKTRLLSFIYAGRAVVIALYVLVPISATTTVLFGIGIGLLWLSTVPLTSAIVASQFGPRNSGTLFGIVFLSHQLGAFIGVWSGGELFDATGSYQVVWVLALLLGLLAAVLHLLIDEGPAPAPPTPADRGAIGLAPGGATAAVVLVAGLAALASTVAAEPAEAAGGEPARSAEQITAPASGPTLLFCGTHIG